MLVQNVFDVVALCIRDALSVCVVFMNFTSLENWLNIVSWVCDEVMS
jgi:hypothetical protein